MVEIVSQFGQAVLSTREMPIIQNSSESSFVSRKFEIYIFDNGFWFRLLIFIYLITRWVDKTLIFLIFRVWLRKSILRIPSFEILPNIVSVTVKVQYPITSLEGHMIVLT